MDYVTFTDTGEIAPLHFTYDGSGRLVEEERPYPGGEVNFFRYEYDAQGNKSREVRADASGTQISDTRFQYDGQGSVIREDTYSPDGTLTAYMTYTYNDAGQQLRLEYHDPDGTLSLYEVNEYDAAAARSATAAISATVPWTGTLFTAMTRRATIWVKSAMTVRAT